MREQQSRQPTDTQQMAESTMNQSREAMEQLIDLQRNMARMTLSALKWQETAQQQGLEMTKSMLESAPGPQFTESMMQSYLQGMEAIMPEMEQVMERGMEAAAQPQMAGMNQMEQMGGQMTGQSQMTGQGGHQQRQQANQQRMQPSQQMGQHGQESSQHGTSQRMEGRRTGGHQPTQHQRMAASTSGQQSGQRTSGPTHGQQSGGQGHQTGGEMRSQPQRSNQYPQTGEWVTPGEYGGESTGAYGYQQQPMTARPSHSRGSQRSGSQSRQGGSDQSQQGSDRAASGQFDRGHQHGGQSRSGYREQHGGTHEHQGQHGGTNEQSTQRSESSQPRTTEQGRFTSQYSQQIDADRREQGERGRPAARDRQEQRHGRQSTQQGSGGPESKRNEGRGRSGRPRGETSRMEEMDIAAEGSERATDETRGDRERGSEQD